MTENVNGVIDIGRLVLAFANVNRRTYHEDGVTPESDTDHTVMVSVCACALAQKLYSDRLDLGLVAQFATVHDLVEAYASDTDTFGLDAEGRKAKDEREHQAFLRIQKEFHGTFPWLPETIEKYESLDTPEARFVKTVDKQMSLITNVINGGARFKRDKLSEEAWWDSYQKVTMPAKIKYGAEFPELIAMIDELTEEVRRVTYRS